MKEYEIVELGNVPWAKPIQAESLEDAHAIVRAELRRSDPSEYVDDWEQGQDLPTVDVEIKSVDGNEFARATFEIGHDSREWISLAKWVVKKS